MREHTHGPAGWIAAAALLLAGAAGAATLDECLTAALHENPDLRAMEARVAAAQAALGEARSAYYPRLGLAAGYARTDNPPQAFMMALNQRALDMADPAFDPNAPDDTDNSRLSATAKMRLFDGGVRGTYRVAARHGAAAAEEQLAAARNELAHQVTRAYYSVLQASAFRDVQQEAVASLEENLRVAGERFAAGSAVRTDVLNLEVKLAETREDLIRARNGVALALAALNTAIGRELVSAAAPPEAGPRAAVAPPVAPAAGAVDARAELQAARRAALVREQAWRRAVRENAPVVNAFGSLDWDSAELDGWEQSYLVGVQAEWEFFAGFENASARRRLRAEWDAAREDEAALRNRLALDLTQAHLQAGEAWERIAVAAKTVESAQEALRITSQRYSQGAADITELLTAQVGLTASRTRDVAAYYDYLTALSNLDRAQGKRVAAVTQAPERTQAGE